VSGRQPRIRTSCSKLNRRKARTSKGPPSSASPRSAAPSCFGLISYASTGTHLSLGYRGIVSRKTQQLVAHCLKVPQGFAPMSCAGWVLDHTTTEARSCVTSL
jgi:hypothetical protein